MRLLITIISLILLSLLMSCGEVGDSNIIIDYIDIDITWVDLTPIGVEPEPNGSYYIEKTYKADSGIGMVWWGNDYNIWGESVNIPAGDPSILPIVEGKGRDSLTEFQFYSFGGIWVGH